MQTRLPSPGGAQLMAYRYDQLNGRRPVRIKQSRAYGPGGVALASGANRYAEDFTYDTSRRGTDGNI
jgi:hypothetical protein